MPILTLRCLECGAQFEKLLKISDVEKQFHYLCPALDHTKNVSGRTELVPSVPSPMQWGCRKGF
jgi:predicted nucleic acid-binding Zn ribbon protein